MIRAYDVRQIPVRPLSNVILPVRTMYYSTGSQSYRCQTSYIHTGLFALYATGVHQTPLWRGCLALLLAAPLFDDVVGVVSHHGVNEILVLVNTKAHPIGMSSTWS